MSERNDDELAASCHGVTSSTSCSGSSMTETVTSRGTERANCESSRGDGKAEHDPLEEAQPGARRGPRRPVRVEVPRVVPPKPPVDTLDCRSSRAACSWWCAAHDRPRRPLPELQQRERRDPPSPRSVGIPGCQGGWVRRVCATPYPHRTLRPSYHGQVWAFRHHGTAPRRRRGF